MVAAPSLAQCTIDYSYNPVGANFGLSPDTLPEAVQGSIYNQDLTFLLPEDTSQGGLTIDFTDLTGQTIGVKSMRLIYTPSNNLSVWTWLIDSDSKIPSYGARVELSNSAGDWGITYHKSEISEDYRLGFDYRHDGVFGFWTENSFQYKIDGSSKKNSSTIGFDYTIPVLNGIYLMTETMHSTLYLPNTHYTVTAFNVDFPIDFLNKFSLVSAISWDNRDTYHLLRFITTYDDFSIDFNTQITDGKWDKNFRISFVYNY